MSSGASSCGNCYIRARAGEPIHTWHRSTRAFIERSSQARHPRSPGSRSVPRCRRGRDPGRAARPARPRRARRLRATNSRQRRRRAQVRRQVSSRSRCRRSAAKPIPAGVRARNDPPLDAPLAHRAPAARARPGTNVDLDVVTVRRHSDWRRSRSTALGCQLDREESRRLWGEQHERPPGSTRLAGDSRATRTDKER